MEFRLEMVTVPVADIDDAKAFYVDRLGFTAVQDVKIDDAHRFVEVVPPGSLCTVALTFGYIEAKPGSLQGVQLNVDDAERANALLRERGVNVTEVQTFPWGRFFFFSDPDGNGGRCTRCRLSEVGCRVPEKHPAYRALACLLHHSRIPRSGSRRPGRRRHSHHAEVSRRGR